MTYAIFFEFARDDDTAQFIFIPATPLGAHTILPTLGYRELSGSRRRTWQVVTSPKYRLDPEVREKDEDVINHEILQLEGISSYITSYLSDPEWTLRASFPVIVTTSDLVELKEHSTKIPVDLNDRVRALRASKGLPS